MKRKKINRQETASIEAPETCKDLMSLAQWEQMLQELADHSPLVFDAMPKEEGEVNSSSLVFLEELCWEKIHSGSWHRVDMLWRDMYSVVCILKCLHDPNGGSNNCIHYLDKGLLMGGTRFREITHLILQSMLPELDLRRQQMLEAGCNGKLLVDPSVMSLDPPPVPRATAQHIMQPIGHTDNPSLEEFMDIFCAQRPCVLHNACNSWPAMKLWPWLEYWRTAAGSRLVPVEIGKDYMSEGWTQKLMPFESFLDSMAGPSIITSEEPRSSARVYLAQHRLLEQIPILQQDIIIPEYCHFTGELNSVNAWIGPAGTVTPCHTDPHDNILVQVVGQKYVRLFAPSCSEAMYPDEVGMTTNTSTIDFDDETTDWAKYPKSKSIHYNECILMPGDALFIPKGWWHFVKSLTASASISFWWDKD